MALVEPDELLAFLRTQGGAWVVEQQATHRPTGRRLTVAELGIFSPYFDLPLLESVRVAEVQTIQNPDFYAPLAAQEVTIPLDFTVMSGITFVDTIVLSSVHAPARPELPRLLFHELVHVVQYRALGVTQFIEQYVNGWAANGFLYEAIPLERQAYALDARFQANGQAFNVAAALAGGIT